MNGVVRDALDAAVVELGVGEDGQAVRGDDEGRRFRQLGVCDGELLDLDVRGRDARREHVAVGLLREEFPAVVDPSDDILAAVPRD